MAAILPSEDRLIHLPPLVAKALGHSDSRVTRKHYARYLTDDLARGIAKMP